MTIRTTHVGSLPRTPELLDANAHRADRGEDAYDEVLRRSVIEVVRRQRALGLSVVNDGEFGHLMSQDVDYGAWWTYSFTRFGGLEVLDDDVTAALPPTPGAPVTLVPFPQRRDWVRFRDAYASPTSGITLGSGGAGFPTVTGPLVYTGHEAVHRDIDNLTRALAASGLAPSDGFLAAVSPGSAARVANTWYATDQELLEAWADALHEEYSAIAGAGLTVQVDDPSLAEAWDQVNPQPDLADYRAYVRTRVEAINHALRGIPPEQVRLHVCWGSWHGPHTTDIAFADIVDLVLQVHAHGFSFEAANARHEHEWTIWGDIELPEGAVLIPGVVGHSTNVVEHPELVAQRIRHFTDSVGPERVIASTDCGLGGRVHPSIAWAKIETLVEGARLVDADLGR